MRDFQTKANAGGAPDTISSTRFGAGEFNSIAVELENAVSTSDQVLAPADGTGEISNQLARALSIYGGGGAMYYADSGAVNAYVLSPISPKVAPPAYFDGMMVLFEPGTPNTTAATINVASLGLKSITYFGGNALSGGEISGSCLLKYNLADDRFELVFNSLALLNIGNEYLIDATQADQGAPSANPNTYTIYDVAALVGTSKSATLRMVHNPTAGNTTSFVFDTSLDLSTYPNLKFDIAQGARFTRTTGDEILTLFQPENIILDDFQTITTVDILRFSNPGIIRVDTWGSNAIPGTSDMTNAIQYAINSFSIPSDGQILFSPNIYQISSTIALNQSVTLQGSMNWSVGTDIQADSSFNDEFITITNSASIKNLNITGTNNAAHTSERLIYINDVNSVKLENLFLSYGYEHIHIDGTSFYTTLLNIDNFGHTGRALNVNSVSSSGVDLMVNNFRILSSTLGDYGILFNGLGSIIASNIMISASTFSSAGVGFVTKATDFGGAQFVNFVFEGGDPAILLDGTAILPWTEMHFTNGIINGGSNPALVLNYVNGATFTDCTFSSTDTSGSVFFTSSKNAQDVRLVSPNFEGTAGVSPIQGGAAAVLSASIIYPRWTGSAPLIDFSSLTYSNIDHLDVFGGNSGSGSPPLSLPSSHELIQGTRNTKNFNHSPYQFVRFTGTLDGAGAANVAYGISNLFLKIVSVQAFYTGGSGEQYPITVASIDGVFISISGGGAGSAYTVVVWYAGS